MATLEFISRDDLDLFNQELFAELRRMPLRIPDKGARPKQWLKSYEVRELIGVSPGTLQQIRKSGKIKYTKIGGLMFYAYEDVEKMMGGKW